MPKHLSLSEKLLRDFEGGRGFRAIEDTLPELRDDEFVLSVGGVEGLGNNQVLPEEPKNSTRRRILTKAHDELNAPDICAITDVEMAVAAEESDITVEPVEEDVYTKESKSAEQVRSSASTALSSKAAVQIAKVPGVGFNVCRKRIVTGTSVKVNGGVHVVGPNKGDTFKE